jgi:hypothetical protein
MTDEATREFIETLDEEKLLEMIEAEGGVASSRKTGIECRSDCWTIWGCSTST